VQEKGELSGRERVQPSVSTAAIDRGVLMAGMGGRLDNNLPPAMAVAEGFTDAEVMLRVKGGINPPSITWCKSIAGRW